MRLGVVLEFGSLAWLFFSHGYLQSCLCSYPSQSVKAMMLLMPSELELDSGDVSDLL